MRVDVTPEAAALLSAMPGVGRRLRLVYDTEGCGCAVNGVPALLAVDGPEPGDMEAETDGPFAIGYDPRHEVFFEDRLVIDRAPDGEGLVLRGEGQIYTPHLRIGVPVRQMEG
ncbi:MAG: hypothetical protein A9Z00_03780 [Thermobacillus sp. ZCTH02-B1]|uniref:iron-sulfur cluster biosynthesis family protein n=1 Tax=Thermobacillus sp. ZCTH02-B1 TaxID=1858795 RepID=UPI000B5843E0|nr:iron-sulfur cluster biosynthesis family protein [Thermobacillus sp. ZCTH02-B1]OUM96711.1 MAG: hypothetical protein A9Z00_03780 [Thermobacillus sp. ZCTH02-B1]